MSTRGPPNNLALRLRQREAFGNPFGAAANSTRKYYVNIYPNQKVLESDSPDAYISRFTPDGQHLVSFAANYQQLVLYDYLGPSPVEAPAVNPAAVDFGSFFQLRYRVMVAQGAEQLCRDFCIAMHGGRFMLLASQTPRLEAHAAEALQQPAGAPTPDVVESITFHVIQTSTGAKVDERRFYNDFFDMHNSGSTSVYDDLVALLSMRTQTVHMMQVLKDGQLLEVHAVGPTCHADDRLCLQMAQQAEQRWQQEQLLARQQSHAAAGPSGHAVPVHGRVPIGPEKWPSQQQQLQQQPFHGEQHLMHHTNHDHHHYQQQQQQQQQQQLLRENSFPASRAAEDAFQAVSAPEQGEAAKSPFIEGFRQRLLAHVFLCLQEGRPCEVAGSLRGFYQGFDTLTGLAIWKAKLLSRHELLLNLGPALPAGAPASSAPHSRFFALYDASSARVLALFRNPSDALVGAFLSCPELFLAPGSNASAWERLSAGMLYAPPLLSSLRAQLRACAPGERATLIRRLLTGLPFMSQSLSSSPYLDSRLYSYDDKQISPIVRLRDAGKHPIKFAPALSSERTERPSKGKGGAAASRARFQLDPAPSMQTTVGGQHYPRRLLHLFHPSDPFVLTVMHTFTMPTLLNIHYHCEDPPSSMADNGDRTAPADG